MKEEKMDEEEEKEVDEGKKESIEMEEIDKELVRLKQTEVSELKRKKKLKNRALKKLRVAIADTATSSALGLYSGADNELFGLNNLKKKEFTEDEIEGINYFSDESDQEI